MRNASRWVVATLLVLAVAGVGSVAGAGAPAKKTSAKLVGVFKVEAADCASGAPEAGSYFRMIMQGGTIESGPYMENGDSPCGDKTFSALEPGTNGGLVNGKYQPQPDPPFDATNNGLADKMVQPVKFFATDFAVSTNKEDPQTGQAVPAPLIKAAKDGTLSGQVKAVSVAWNGQQFNQGSPKPDGSEPGGTTALTGDYDAKTGKYAMEWTSQIVGGPFDGFTGYWHLEGTFKKAKK